MFQRRRIGKPDFPMTIAMIHTEPEGHAYSKQIIKDAIAFVEEHYGVKYDWDEFFKYAKLINEQNTIELGLLQDPVLCAYRHCRNAVPSVLMAVRQRHRPLLQQG